MINDSVQESQTNMLSAASLANALGMQLSSSTTGQSSNLGAAAQNLLMVWTVNMNNVPLL